MFAVIKTGGKQYRVESGDLLRVEKLAADAGDKVQFNEILMLGGDTPVVGAPLVADAGVQAEVIDQIKGEKVIHFVKRRRKHGSQRTKGHRQQLTLLRVTEILGKGAGKSGIKAAVGAAALAAGSGDTRYAKNKTDQAEMKKRVATAGEAEEKSATKAKTAAPKKADAKTADAKPAAPKKAAPKKADAAGADDLKQLSGVGPALEKKLHEAGVTTFAQIAAWNDKDIAEMDEKLSFKGRIEREGWVDQAKKLAK